MKVLWAVLFAVMFVFAGLVSAACPSADISGDCKVNLDDFAVISFGWMTDYNSSDLEEMASQWLDNGAFVTTWDTSLDDGEPGGGTTTVTLALAGTVDVVIDWGDGFVETVTTAGPHVHDYGVDGIYTVSVSGSVEAYNSLHNGGALSEHAKLVSVDNWGQVGFTSLYSAFWHCSNLISVPSTSEGIEAVTDMGGMFIGASSFNHDISNWDTFNVINMEGMFVGAESFNQDLSGWCVVKIPSEPLRFYGLATNWTLARPVWGTCP